MEGAAKAAASYHGESVGHLDEILAVDPVLELIAMSRSAPRYARGSGSAMVWFDGPVNRAPFDPVAILPRY